MPAKIYQNTETAVTWRGSGGSELITLASLGAGVGRQGALHDFGAGARAREGMWRAFIRWNTAPSLGEIVRIYWKTSDGMNPDNDDGTGDISVSNENKLKNLQLIGVIIADEALANIPSVAHGIIDMPHRHGGPVFWNASATDILHSTAANHGFDITPIPWESQ